MSEPDALAHALSRLADIPDEALAGIDILRRAAQEAREDANDEGPDCGA